MSVKKTRSSYQTYLESDHWKQLRKRAYDVAGNRCECCLDPYQILNAHHIRYRPVLEDCTEDDLVCLCKDCHMLLHRSMDEKRIGNGQLDRNEAMELIRYEWDTIRMSQPKNQRRYFFMQRRIIENQVRASNKMSRKQSEKLRKILGYPVARKVVPVAFVA